MEAEDTNLHCNFPPKKPHHIPSSSEGGFNKIQPEAQALSPPIQPQNNFWANTKKKKDDNVQVTPSPVQPWKKVQVSSQKKNTTALQLVIIMGNLGVTAHDLYLDCPWSSPGPVWVQTQTPVLQCDDFLKNYLSLIFIYIKL